MGGVRILRAHVGPCEEAAQRIDGGAGGQEADAPPFDLVDDTLTGPDAEGIPNRLGERRLPFAGDR